MRIVLALMLALSLPARGNEIPDWFAETFLDVREDAADAAKQGKRLMLYFWLEGCPYCRQMETVTFQHPQIAARMQREVVPVAMNVRGDRQVTGTDRRTLNEKSFTALLKVRGTPTMIFFDAEGEVAFRVSGYQNPQQFGAVLDRVR